jgi:hypothetical protein
VRPAAGESLAAYRKAAQWAPASRNTLRQRRISLQEQAPVRFANQPQTPKPLKNRQMPGMAQDLLT